MSWLKPSENLVEYLAVELAPFDTQVRKMFGVPVHFLFGNMMAGVFENSVFIRLSDSDRAEILAEYDTAANFEPLAGRPMREYIVLPQEVISDRDSFYEWLSRSVDFVSSLPPKIPKKK